MKNEKKLNKENLKKVDIMDVLLDENNTAPIHMLDDKGKTISFDQIAVIPIGGEELYCILKPITPVPGIKDDEAVVFKVKEGENGSFLEVVENSDIAIEVFEKYYDLVEEASEE